MVNGIIRPESKNKANASFSLPDYTELLYKQIESKLDETVVINIV